MQADYVLDYDVVSSAREQRLYLLARIQAGSAPNAHQRLPLNLSVVLDRSGSMSGDKLENVKKAAQFLVQHLGTKDLFSLVSYDTNVTVDISPAPVVYKDQINQTIQAIKAGSSTNLSGGWLQGCQQVADKQADGQVNRVLLLTDGLANQGVTEPARLAAMARQKRDAGITTTTLGVGMGFNEDLLRQMAAEGGGAFYFIDNPDQAPHIFAEELKDLLSVVGQNLVITLQPSDNVQMIRQFNTYPEETVRRNVIFRLGDLFAEEVKMILLEFSIPALATLGKVEVARLRFEYDELGPESSTHRVQEVPIIVNAVPEGEMHKHKPNEEVVKTVLLLQAARAREEAVRFADAGEFDRASQTLSDIADAIHESEIEDKELSSQHNMLREEAIDMEMGAARYDSYSRKSSTTKFSYGSTRPSHFQDETVLLHSRLKSSRRALERKGTTPTAMLWNRERLELNKDRIAIGRAEDNDVAIPQEEVSQHHCQIVREGSDLFLEDLGSTNGTFANGGLLQGRFRLSIGDVVSVGTWLFMFQ